MKYVTLLTLFWATQVLALDCDKVMTTPDINACAKQDQERVEVELNRVYQKVMKSLSKPDTDLESHSETKATLRKAQRLWIKFREADCDAVYLQHMSGTIRTVMHIGCMQSHAEQRIKELQAFMDGE